MNEVWAHGFTSTGKLWSQETRNPESQTRFNVHSDDLSSSISGWRRQIEDVADRGMAATAGCHSSMSGEMNEFEYKLGFLEICLLYMDDSVYMLADTRAVLHSGCSECRTGIIYLRLGRISTDEIS